MIVPGILVCSSFLISVCMFIVSKALFISNATVIVRTGGAIWWNPFAMVLVTVCSAATVECCANHHQRMPPISKDCSNTFIDRSFIYAALWHMRMEQIE